MNEAEKLETRCCVVGGGPAGMMLGFLLARAGVEVVVLEKHRDFLRDFRGDTIHPSTLEVMNELGLLDEFLKRPHDEARELMAQIGETAITIADFSRLPTRCKFIAFMPQWDFLDFISEQARRHARFQLKMEAEVTGLIHEHGRYTGVIANTPGGPLEIRADLIVGADGRGSIVRKAAGLQVMDIGAPMDVLWMRISRRPDDPGQSLGRIEAGSFAISIDRGSYWQCAYVIRKGSFEQIQQKGLPAFREQLSKMMPFLRDRVGEIRDWSDINLLTVKVDRVRQWYRPGLLCIGDAAHAMSPIGGVGINLAIQDAVASAVRLGHHLLQRRLTTRHLQQLQRRRELPVKLTQYLQVFLQNRIITGILTNDQAPRVPLAMELFRRWPWLRRIPARLIGMGFRPEHIKFPIVEASSVSRRGLDRATP